MCTPKIKQCLKLVGFKLKSQKHPGQDLQFEALVLRVRAWGVGAYKVQECFWGFRIKGFRFWFECLGLVFDLPSRHQSGSSALECLRSSVFLVLGLESRNRF